MIGVVKSVLLIVQSTRGKEILTLSKEHVTKLSKECSTLQSAKPKISDFDFFFFEKYVIQIKILVDLKPIKIYRLLLLQISQSNTLHT